MEERGYVAEALLDRLQDDGVQFRALGPPSVTELVLAVPGEALAGMARRIARFGQDLDLRLVQLARPEHQRARFVLAWSDEVGRPSFLAVDVLADHYRAGRRLLGADELLAGRPDALFFWGLAEAIEDQRIDDARAAWLTGLWHADARGSIERIGRIFRERRQIRLLAQAARQGAWDAARAALPALRRALRRAVLPGVLGLAAKARAILDPKSVRVTFIGFENSALRERVERDLAPAVARGVSTVEVGFADRARGRGVAVLFDPPASYERRFEENIVVERAEAVPPAAAKVERALLRWLERRVERRFSATVVGANPLAARLLQFACRHRMPLVADFLGTLLNCGLECPLRSPILMPHPFGIFIHRNAVIGSRVTVMHQVTIGNKHASDPGAPVIEDNVTIGAGAKILGAVRIGHGSTVGANAVVTRDVPSHCTVVGVNRILGAAVVDQRHSGQASVVNT